MTLLAKHVRSERLAYAEEVLAQTLDRGRALQLIARKFGISERHAHRYIRAVLKCWEIEAMSEKGRNRRRAQIRAGYRSVYQEARAAGDRRNALGALRAMADLDGLNAPQQHEVAVVPPPMPVKVIDTTEAKSRLRLLKSGGEEE